MLSTWVFEAFIPRNRILRALEPCSPQSNCEYKLPLGSRSAYVPSASSTSPMRDLDTKIVLTLSTKVKLPTASPFQTSGPRAEHRRLPSRRSGMLSPLGQTVSVSHGNLADTHGVCGSVALIQIGILGEGFLLSRHPIGWLIEIQFLAVGDVLDPIRSGFLIAIYFLKVV